MLHCWSLSPELRPSFSKIVARLESLLQSSEDYLDMSEQSGQSGEQSGQLPAEPPLASAVTLLLLLLKTNPKHKLKINLARSDKYWV